MREANSWFESKLSFSGKKFQSRERNRRRMREFSHFLVWIISSFPATEKKSSTTHFYLRRRKKKDLYLLPRSRSISRRHFFLLSKKVKFVLFQKECDLSIASKKCSQILGPIWQPDRDASPYWWRFLGKVWKNSYLTTMWQYYSQNMTDFAHQAFLSSPTNKMRRWVVKANFSREKFLSFPEFWSWNQRFSPCLFDEALSSHACLRN